MTENISTACRRFRQRATTPARAATEAHGDGRRARRRRRIPAALPNKSTRTSTRAQRPSVSHSCYYNSNSNLTHEIGGGASQRRSATGLRGKPSRIAARDPHLRIRSVNGNRSELRQRCVRCLMRARHPPGIHVDPGLLAGSWRVAMDRSRAAAKGRDLRASPVLTPARSSARRRTRCLRRAARAGLFR